MFWLYNLVVVFLLAWATFAIVQRIQKVQKQSQRKKLALALGCSYILLGLILTAVSSLNNQDWFTYGGMLVGAGTVMLFQIKSKQ